MVILVPSILAANFANLEKDIRECEKNGISMFHLDIMDGHFVPNISFGAVVVKAMRKITGSKLDVHLMIEHPAQYISQFVRAGADIITVHVETISDLSVIYTIKNAGVYLGMALNPETSFSAIKYYLPHLDYLLIMSVHPGFSGQRFINTTLNKIREAKAYFSENNITAKIQVDGGINANNIRAVIEAGAEYIVAASAVFSGNITKNLKTLYSAMR